MKNEPEYLLPNYDIIVPELRPTSMGWYMCKVWCNGWYDFWKGKPLDSCSYQMKKDIHQWRKGWRAAESVKGEKPNCEKFKLE